MDTMLQGGSSNIAELALLKRYWAAFMQSREAILFFKHGRLVDANPSALALLAIEDRAQLLALDILCFSPPTQPSGQCSEALGNAYIQQAFSKGEMALEWWLRDLNGREFPAEIMLSRLKLPDGVVLQATIRDISEREAQRNALLQREKDLLDVHRIAQIGNWVSDFESGEICWCEQVYHIFGRPRDEPITHDLFLLTVHPDDRERVQAAFNRAMRGAPYEVIHRIVRPDGQERTVHERGQIEFDPHGRALRMLGSVQDITEQTNLENNLRRLVAILDSTSDLITMHGPDGAMLYMNNAGRRFHGLPTTCVKKDDDLQCGWQRYGLPEETGSLSATIRRFHPEWAAQRIEQEALPTALRDGLWQGETALLTSSGEEVPVSQVIIVHYDDSGRVAQTSSMIRDISAQKRLEAQLAHSAVTDHLTGIYNRKRFDEEVDKALARRRRSGVNTALILLDIDHFKLVNDTYGHDVGDQVLIDITRLLQQHLRVQDLLARWGGEEFVMLLSDTTLADGFQLAERLRQLIAEHTFSAGAITASLGVTLLHADDTPSQCIKRLDLALYQAKRAGRNQVVEAVV
ncbi:sensor domain-containing diguanylate cyclase [Halomonas sp. GFAJ-1]|uniref:sensor domain-containing diguanylate cyclase n=1 Tax=Halomonas sp. GFAJ-1 TaxID=1118153 RepID=UPI00023A33E4|nr:diguanylate cyclase [Halomonas sp. GFAJ-1]EHK59903.1 PAS/PAC sensor-containing diguanylate cyclase [Halomonas sp. GFAJ-1]